MPNKESRAIGVRIPDKDYERIMEKATRKGWTFNRWMNWAISLGLRKHDKKDH